MAEQIHKLILDSERPNITIRLLPFTAELGGHPPSSFAVLDIPTEPATAYLDGGGCGDMVVDEEGIRAGVEAERRRGVQDCLTMKMIVDRGAASGRRAEKRGPGAGNRTSAHG
ncbi:hypothetical protein D5S18_18020 [Nocardia panacis]|uniref:DUF5753 domain-containing protein n=2 Tax=Nocardia panacis TaxID=2340916 RepID=A0A3A4KQG7_9NOCA|nr:hypothetical protein D5S18_18020 [Nocardia panacis]